MSDFNRGSERVAGFFSKKLKQVMMGGMALVIAFSALSSVYKVDTTEVAVVDKFGEIVRVEQDPGLKFKIPFVEGKKFYSKTIQDTIVEDLSIKTEDGQEIRDVDLKIKWKYDADQVEYYRSNLDNPSVLLKDLAEAVTKGVIGKVNTTEISDQREEVESQIRDKLAERAKALYKLHVTNVEFSDFEFDAAYTKQLQDNMEKKAEVERAKQEAEKAKFEKERDITAAEGKKQSAILQAEGEAEATRLKADAEAHKITTEGEAQAKAIEAQAKALGDNPLLVELEKAKKWGGDVPSTVVGEGATPIINLNGAGSVVPVPGK